MLYEGRGARRKKEKRSLKSGRRRQDREMKKGLVERER
jgi:hypothetical protein